MSTRFETAPDDPEALIDRLLAGQDLRVFLSPDPELKFQKKEPRYFESLALPYVAIADRSVWGSTDTNHLAIMPGETQVWLKAFAYSPHRTYYACIDQIRAQDAFDGKKMSVRIMPRTQYATMEFKLAATHEAIWRFGDPEDAPALAPAIEAGKTFRLAVRVNTGAWLIAPVNIPCWYPDRAGFKVATDCCFLPGFFFQPDALDASLAQSASELLESTDPMQSVDLQAPPISTFMEFHSNGSYTDIRLALDGKKSSVKDAILLAER